MTDIRNTILEALTKAYKSDAEDTHVNPPSKNGYVAVYLSKKCNGVWGNAMEAALKDGRMKIEGVKFFNRQGSTFLFQMV